jgi:hypothetical protein
MKFRVLPCILGLVVLISLASGAPAQPQLAWDGTQWKDFPQEIKVAYLKGVLNMAAYETASGGAGRGACISRAFTEELKTKTLGQVIAEVDKFYKENPGKLNMPVIDVMMRSSTKLCPPETAAKGTKK